MQCDVLIVGGGIAGLIAANRVAQFGLAPMVCEAGEAPDYVCSTRYCGGVFHVAFRSAMQRPEILRAAIVQATRGLADPEMVDAMVADSGRVVSWLRAEGIQFIQGGPEEYQSYVLAPPKPSQPGLEWRGRGGDVLMRSLSKRLMQRGGQLVRGARVVNLTMVNGRCTGAEVLLGGETRHVQAHAVILADGGFQGNQSLVRRFISPAPEKLMQRGAGTGIGDGIVMAEAIGAALVGMESFYGHLLSRDAMSNDQLWPYPVIDHLAAAGMVVNRSGQRFTDESLGGVSIANAIARLADPLSTTVIFDEAIWQGAPGCYRHTAPNPHLLSKGATIYRAADIETLAKMADLPPDALSATIAGHNEAVMGRNLGAVTPCRNGGSAEAYPILRAPFYAIPVCAGISYTMGGIRIDSFGHILDRGEATIPGLFAAGSTTGGLEGGATAGYVGGLVKSSVMGIRAAETIVRELHRAGP